MLKNAKSAQLHYSLYVYLRTNTYELMVLIERLLWTNHPSPDARTSHLRTLSKISRIGLSAFPVSPQRRSTRVSRPL
jgi:hypothetical protein